MFFYKGSLDEDNVKSKTPDVFAHVLPTVLCFVLIEFKLLMHQKRGDQQKLGLALMGSEPIPIYTVNQHLPPSIYIRTINLDEHAGDTLD